MSVNEQAKYTITINSALFELVCGNLTEYDKQSSEKMLDILKHTEYVVDPKYIDELYSKKIMLFSDPMDRIALTEKLCCKGQLDISVIYIYDLHMEHRHLIDYIDEKIHSILLRNPITENEVIRVMEYINCNEIKNMKLIVTIVNDCVSFDFKNKKIYNQIKIMFKYLVLDVSESKNLLLKLIIMYINILKDEIIVLFESGKLTEILSGCHENIILLLYESFDCEYDQINIVEETFKELLQERPDILPTHLIEKKKIKNDVLQCKYPDGFEKDDIIYSFKYIDAQTYSNYLSKKVNRPLLKHFIHLDNYTDVRLVNSMRTLLNKIVLPKESQDIIFILETFSEHYANCNMRYAELIIFQLTCAILMLNTDLHNPNVLKKISLQKFINNWYKNIDINKQIPKKILESIYDDIRKNEFLFIK